MLLQDEYAPDDLTGRFKLVIESIDHPELIDATFSSVSEVLLMWFMKNVPNQLWETGQTPLCENFNHKYYIAIDGNASGFMRGPIILASNTVPIVIESLYRPLYLDAWVPWVHFVPVKNDQSDLYEKIKWLQDNDLKAQEIAMNGRKLFDKLYNLQNMIEDTTNVFVKYASLMKYEIERPPDKFKWRDSKFRHQLTPAEYNGSFENEEEEEFDED